MPAAKEERGLIPIVSPALMTDSMSLRQVHPLTDLSSRD